MIYADQRWIGDHGIGRFARQVLSTLEYTPVPLKSHPASALDAWRLARALSNAGREDIIFSPGYNPPLFCAASFVFTLHDLNHIDRPENSSRLKRLYYATVMKRSCRKAARILTVSEFTRRRIVDWSGVRPEKVVNVGCGVSPEFHPEGAAFSLPFPYLLCVSNRKHHKNEFRTVKAFAQAHMDAEMRLVFTGNPTQELLNCIERCHLAQRVCFVGSVPDAELPSLYRSAAALVFASLYEGFGLPVLEAMACGTPVVTSNTSSLPEIAGDAALLVDPNSVDEIALGMDRILNDTSLRNKLRSKGLERAAHFTWEMTTANVHRVLREVAIEQHGKR